MDWFLYERDLRYERVNITSELAVIYQKEAIIDIIRGSKKSRILFSGNTMPDKSQPAFI